jgi:CRP-like cAMP-binding protein
MAEAKMDHAITAITECEYAAVPSSLLRGAAVASANISTFLVHAALIDNAALRVWLRNSEDAEASTAHLLSELHARLSIAGLVRDNTFRVPITQEQMGDALGLTAVHTNRMLRKVRDAGLIITRPGEITIADVGALHSLCAFNHMYLHRPSEVQ